MELLLICCVLIFLLHNEAESQSVCNQDVLDRSFVTQCGPIICEPVVDFAQNDDKKGSEWPESKEQVVHIVSTRAGERFKINRYDAIDTNKFYFEESHVNGTMFVDTQTKYQRILGFGTTMTDASCKNVDDLPDDIRRKLISDYFSTDLGIGLNLIKVPIGSTKFSYSNYVLDQPDGNLVELSPYDLDYRIPMINEALESSGKFKNRIKILASSASAPPEFKENNMMIRAGYLKQDQFKSYAAYLNNYIGAYKSLGLNIWGLILSESPVSVGELSEAPEYNSMAMDPSDSVKLVKEFDEIANTRSDSNKIRILLLGDNKVHIPVWSDFIFNSQDVKPNSAGIAYVSGDETLVTPYDSLNYFSKKHSSKYLLTLRGSKTSDIKLGNWQHAEDYATDMVKNLQFGSVGWIDFNLALNLQGGPVVSEKYKGKMIDREHSPSFSYSILINLIFSNIYSSANAAVMVDTKQRVYYRNPMFYAIGHLSRYVKPGSIRVKVMFYSSAHMYASQYIAFITPENYLVVFVSNNNIGPMPINIGIDTRTKVEVLLDTKSFNTFIFKL